MRLWAEFVPGFSDLAWEDLKKLRIKFWMDSESGVDCYLVKQALLHAPRTFVGTLSPQPLRVIEGEAIKVLEYYSAQLVEAAKQTFHPSMAKMKRPIK